MTRRSPRVRGFAFAGIRCGVKEKGPDLALIASDRPATAAGVFTRSTVPGAPVLVSKRRVRDGRARAVVVNAGISNVGMGARGIADAEAMAERAARCLGVPPGQVLVASTGVIGERLPMECIDAGIPRAVRALRADGIGRTARAIMTTDTVPKARGRSFRIGGRRHAVAGVAKGSGMIEPKMATMLAYLVTDAAVEAPLLRGMWREVAEETFNRVTIDGETSTSDMAVVFANGAGGGRPLRSAGGAAARSLGDALRHVATELARDLARDGEGATKLVTVDVSGARNAADAERAARRIANSLLVKTALFGRDPNWGRILQTIGAGETRLDLARTRVRLGGILVFARGASTGPQARARAGQRLQAPDIGIEVHLGVGDGAARVWTCDLSTEYVRINAEYTT
jgi:glutamate N-acetyltransferase/amino-acid N-acetyltransferase